MRQLGRLAAAGLLAACAMSLASTPRAEAAVVNAASGTTNIRMSNSFRAELADSGITVSAATPACIRTCYLRFPMTNARINPANARGYYRHSGGFTLHEGRHRVSFTNLRIRVTGGRSTVSARINGSRQWRVIFGADLTDATITRPGLGTTVKGVRLTWTRTAARILRRSFSERAFHAGMPFGSATIGFNPREASINGGDTQLVMPQGTIDALTADSIALGVAAPATSTTAGTIAFPVTGGRLIISSLAGGINHSGGMTLTKGAATVTISNLQLDTRSSELWASINGGTATVIGELDLASPSVTITSQQMRIAGVGVSLNAAAATALNTALASAVFVDGLDLGDATVTATTD